LGVVGVMGMPYMTLMPVFAAHVHTSGADTVGIMFGASGATVKSVVASCCFFLERYPPQKICFN
jgi:uncharacterized membrane protein YadS